MIDPENIAKLPIFASLTPEEFAAVLPEFNQIHLRSRQILFTEEHAGDKIFVVASGKIKLSKETDAGKENILAVVGPGELLGELTLFDPGPHSVRANSVGSSELLWLSHKRMLELLDDYPGLAKYLLQYMAKRLHKSDIINTELVFSDVPGRLAKIIADFAERFGEPRNDGVLVQHGLTQGELAGLAGASRETVNKTLSDFVNRGWIRLKGREIMVLELDRLQRRAVV